MTTPPIELCFACREPVPASGLAPHIRRRHPDLVLNDELLVHHGLTSCTHCHQLYCTARGLVAHMRSCGRFSSSAFSSRPPLSPILALRGANAGPTSGSLAPPTSAGSILASFSSS